ncbi:uncharacterized protein PSFLO_07304 [Pseudozyma flocculosa]|uniref:Uncharacterized protein n=1 Tax=Pseudozyma flocculosa TaxID=84751 RepID=A0A5C3FBQ7_9BASI|nr:uncharacterized protein PSFLO_07304 [Pseudozyma flocculosa]
MLRTPGSASGAAHIVFPRPSHSALAARDHALLRPIPKSTEDQSQQGDPHPALQPGSITHPQLHTLLLTLELLAPPVQFGYERGQGWRSDAAAYTDLLHWRDVEAVALLDSVQHQLSQLDPQLFAGEPLQRQLEWTLFNAVVALARFVPVAAHLEQGDAECDEAEASEDDDEAPNDGWVTSKSTGVATDALSSATSLLASRTTLSRYRLATSLLDIHIQPLYRASAQSGPTDPTTGRKRAPAPGHALLVSPGMGVHDSLDEVPAWKGGDVTVPPAAAAAAANAGGGAALAPSLAQRDSALGNWNVLAYAIVLLRRCCAGADDDDGDDVWRRTWYRLVPPLMALLEDHEPRFRLAASRLVQLLLLPSSSSNDEERGIDATLVRTTGIATLLESGLEANLHLTTDALGPL